MDDIRAERNLRASLKRACAEEHDRLDRMVSRLDLCSTTHYRQFLTMQLSARAPIERWALRHCPDTTRPPPMVPLLLEDLAELGEPFSVPRRNFHMPDGADPLGMAWALAGSQMGNRAILTRMRKAGASTAATRFLSDDAMTGFWNRLRPTIEQAADPAQVNAASMAARAVFACFAEAAQAEQDRLAA
ncbi:heme oxygenase [Altererythrobacter atlanticus]|uniref:Uncharacterized protein n=1 Tax=Croceibacterium atlanticum TaxID=1267766 RepID=A0A0F7KU25_9SPHN|nr:biliverdin-producing heme oxygenase [Croceibacterium atlanticum]AKH43863.1 hypothetical protein WYH_02835 [Croceibacterium atlanticum]MBB5733687.1 heme oxygenase [Croceibacterium atlanticum]